MNAHGGSAAAYCSLAPLRDDIQVLRSYESAVAHAQCVRKFLELQRQRLNSRSLYLLTEFPEIVRRVIWSVQAEESAVRRHVEHHRRHRRRNNRSGNGSAGDGSSGAAMLSPSARGRQSFTRRWSAWLTRPSHQSKEEQQQPSEQPPRRPTTEAEGSISNGGGGGFSPVLPPSLVASNVRCESAGPMVRFHSRTTSSGGSGVLRPPRRGVERSLGREPTTSTIFPALQQHNNNNHRNQQQTRNQQQQQQQQQLQSSHSSHSHHPQSSDHPQSSHQPADSSTSGGSSPPLGQRWTRCRKKSYGASRGDRGGVAATSSSNNNSGGCCCLGGAEDDSCAALEDSALGDALDAICTDVETDVEIVADGGVDTDTNSEGGRPAARASVLEPFDGLPHPFWGTEAEQSSWVSVPNPAKLDPECKVLIMLRALANNNTPWPYGSSTLVRHYKAFLKYGLAPRVLTSVWSKDLKGGAAWELARGGGGRGGPNARGRANTNASANANANANAAGASAANLSPPSHCTCCHSSGGSKFERASGGNGADVTTTATTTGRPSSDDAASPREAPNAAVERSCSCDATPCCSQEWRLQAESSRVSGEDAAAADDYEPCPVDPTWRNVYSSKLYVLERAPKKPVEEVLRRLRDYSSHSAPVTPTVSSGGRLVDCAGQPSEQPPQAPPPRGNAGRAASHALLRRCDVSWQTFVPEGGANAASVKGPPPLRNRILYEYLKRLENRGKLKVRSGRRTVTNNKEIIREGRDWIRFHQVKEFVPVSRWQSVLRPKPVPTPKSLLAPPADRSSRPAGAGCYPSFIPTIMRGPATQEDLQAKYLHHIWQTRRGRQSQATRQPPGGAANSSEEMAEKNEAESSSFSSSNLKVWVGGYMIPHDTKRYRRGDDSWFGSESLRCFGLCDGVGELGDAQWRVAGFDCRGFGEDILREAKSRVQTIRAAPAPLPATRPRLVLPPGKTRAHKEWLPKDFVVDPATPQPSVLALDALVAGFYGKQSTYGAATCLIGCIDRTGTRVGFANIGDSRAMVLRRDQLSTGALSCVGTTDAEQHGWNMPVQLARFPDVRKTKNMHKDTRLQQLARQLDSWRATGLDNNDRPETAALYDFAIREGDLIVLGTDGLWDNLFDSDVQALCGVALSPRESEILTGGPFQSTAPRDLAKGLCLAAYWRSMQSDADTPFARSVRQAEGSAYQLGGKADDISVVCAWVVAPRLENTPALLLRCREEKAFSRHKERQRTPRASARVETTGQDKLDGELNFPKEEDEAGDSPAAVVHRNHSSSSCSNTNRS